MSASEVPDRDAIAFQFLAALDEYDLHAGRMIADWPDPQPYRSLSEQVDRLRMYSSALPERGCSGWELPGAQAQRTGALRGLEGVAPVPRQPRGSLGAGEAGGVGCNRSMGAPGGRLQ
jgi:hypothetical protein